MAHEREVERAQDRLLRLASEQEVEAVAYERVGSPAGAEPLEVVRRDRDLVLGARAVLIKGGHLSESAQVREAIDLLDDDGEVTVFRGPWIEGGNVRGTGCMLSAAIAAGLAKEMDLQVAVAEARDFVRVAISRSNDPWF